MSYKYCKDCRHANHRWNKCQVTGYPCHIERAKKYDHISDCGFRGELWQPNLTYRFFAWFGLKDKK